MDQFNTQPQVNSGQPMEGSATPEQMSKLQELMEQIEGKYQDFNSARLSSGNQVEDQKNEALRELFDLFSRAGIDPSDPDQIQAFLDRVRSTNPEMSQRLEEALSSLLGNESAEVAPVDPNMPPQDAFPEGQNMNIQNANPSENL